jgi:arylsulfatase
MFRGEKNTNWEGGYRVPTLIRWPGTIKPGTIINDICAHEDMMPTLLAAAGEPEIVDELLKGKTIGDRTYKVHLDGYDLAPALKGEGEWHLVLPDAVLVCLIGLHVSGQGRDSSQAPAA